MIKQTEALLAAREALIGHGAECKEVNDALALIDQALTLSVSATQATPVLGSCAECGRSDQSCRR